MSAGPLSSKHKAALGVVAVLAVAVIILNIQTFGGKSRPSRRVQASVQDVSALPEDLATLVQNADLSAGLGRRLGRSPRTDHSGPDRDPFLAYRPQVSVAVSEPAAEPEAPQLGCSAILLGGKRSTAMINGKSYGAGDTVAGLTVMSVNTRGVLLQDKSGGTVFLNVGTVTTGGHALKMEFSKKTRDEIAMDTTERNLP